jgi:uncharacterized membrane protein YgdD (TMEM256/DUF423 family)
MALSPQRCSAARARFVATRRRPNRYSSRSMDRVFFALGALSGATAVVLGAFAAHGLKSRLTAEALVTFETGARYHAYHALALLAVAWACARWPGAWANAAGWLFVTGTVLFSGSLYVLAVTGIRALGAITPFGGLAFILGWLALALAAWFAR